MTYPHNEMKYSVFYLLTELSPKATHEIFVKFNYERINPLWQKSPQASVKSNSDSQFFCNL